MYHVRFSVFTDYTTEELMEWHPSRVTRTRTRVIGVILSDFLIKGKEIFFELAGSEFEFTE